MKKVWRGISSLSRRSTRATGPIRGVHSLRYPYTHEEALAAYQRSLRFEQVMLLERARSTGA